MKAFTSRDVAFDEESILQEKSEIEDKAQDGAPNNLVGTQVKKVEFSDGPKRPYRSNEDSSDTDEDG